MAKSAASGRRRRNPVPTPPSDADRIIDAALSLVATEGTARHIRTELGLPVETVTKKLNEGHPNVLDVIVSGRVSAVINTVTGDRRPLRYGGAGGEREIPHGLASF